MRFFRYGGAYALAFLLVFSVQAQSALAQTTSSITGTVISPDSKPATNVPVTLRGSNVSLTHTSDSKGHFAFFGLTVGSYTLTAQSSNGFGTVSIDLTSGGADVSLNLLKDVGQVRIVRALTVRGSGTDIVFNQVQLQHSTAAGSLPSLLLQLPGAARGANGVVHINGDHGDVNYIVDGVPMPQELDRQIGTEFDPNDISYMEAIEGAYPAQYGDRFATVVNIDTKTAINTTAGASGYVQGGSFGHWDQSLNYHTAAGNGSLVVGVRNEMSNWMLDPPDYSGIHDKGSNANQFLRYTLPYNNGRDYFDFSVTHSYRTYQIPPDTGLAVPANTDDNESQNESFASLEFHHALRGNGALTYGVSYNQSHIIDFNDPFNDFVSAETLNLANGGTASDCASGTVSACGFSVFADRTARDVIFNLDNVVRSTHHEVRWGAIEDATTVQKLYQIDLQPNNYLDPANNPAVPSGAAPYTCTGPSGVCTVVDNAPNVGHNTQAYVQDSWRLGDKWELDYGLRYDSLQVTSTQFATNYDQFSPRVKLTRLFGPRASAYAYYGRFFTPFALENVSPSAAYTINYPQQPTLAQFDLRPQRDSDYEIGGHLPIGAGELGLRVMQKNATDWIDDTQVGNTALFQNINYALGRVAVQGATYTYPLARSGEVWASVDHTYAVDMGCETQLLAPCFGSSSTDWAPADHDQRWDVASGVTLNDVRGGWFTLDGEYGSGLSSAYCMPLTDNCKVPPHTIFNLEKGVAVGPGHGAVYVRILNFLNDRYYITYLNAQGNHVGYPRAFELGYAFGR
jgi:hypothetical protein